MVWCDKYQGLQRSGTLSARDSSSQDTQQNTHSAPSQLVAELDRLSSHSLHTDSEGIPFFSLPDG
jgi:hypothetical protein